MLINLRNALMGGKRTPTAKDYVQDGLIAMWDGIENAGWGTHDASATTWKDLVGNRDWTLGPSTSYEWTANSFDAKNRLAATQDFIDGSLVKTIEFCAKIKSQQPAPGGNYAFIILGRIASVSSSNSPYYGLLYRTPASHSFALMGGLAVFEGTYSEFSDKNASMSFPSYDVQNVNAYFDRVPRQNDGNNSLDYNATSRGTTARIGGTLLQSMPVEVFNMRLYSTVLTANYAIDKARFGLP